MSIGRIVSNLWCRSIKPLLRYRDFFIFFPRWRLPPSWIFNILDFYWSEWSRRPNCVTVPNFVEIAQTSAEICRFFKTVAVTIVTNFFMVGLVKSVEVRHCAKLCGDRSNRCQNMTIFRFFLQDGGHPPSWICDACVGTIHEGQFGGLYHCAIFSCNWCISFDNTHVFRFREFGLKRLIHAPKMGVLTL